MLFKLINTDNINFSDQDVFCALNNLLTAYRESKHILFSEESVFQTISESQEFDALNKNAAVVAHSNRRRTHALFSAISTHVIVDFFNPNIEEKKEVASGIEIRIGYKYFIDSSSTQPIKLLCEDLTDTDFYSIVASVYKKNQQLRNLDVCFEPTNGGGGSIKGNFEQLSKNKKLCFCILDSDKKHPKDKLGSTCAGFNSGITSFSTDFHVINAHEAESLIPSRIIDELIRKGLYGSEKSIELERLESIENANPFTKIYYDHKEGFTIQKLISLSKYSPRDFWWGVFQHNKNFKQTACLKNMECECDPPCRVSEGFGQKLLDFSIPYMKSTSPSKINEMLSPPLKAEWGNIGKKLFSWGCATNNVIRTS
ncbi:hypothetical protein JHW33_08490 [Rahnella aceris]|uniref:hypothetical protein n=1 Tax=Rahnella sp. (strain Y9602) TaxID=2703885 RepID=UPI00190627F5|nr:hypothetical protein [Rahnella aceris]QQN36630.1 hypothetical protein JHW33_08490 [Rahnella aceris]